MDQWPTPRLDASMRLIGACFLNPEYNACINMHVGESAASLYRQSFRRGAEELIDAVLSQRPLAWIDVLVYPAVFLYRHHLELLLKAVIAEAHEVLESDARPRFGHELAKLWVEARGLVERALPDADWTQNDEATRLISEFDAVDPKGESFRYALGRDGKPSLRDEEHLNLRRFAESMGALCDYLDEVLTGLGSRNPRRVYD